MMGKGSEGSAQIKEKTLEQSKVADAGQGGRTKGPSLVRGGWMPNGIGYSVVWGVAWWLEA